MEETTMKKYYTITMILKNPSTDDDEFTLSGKYVIEEERELDEKAKDLAQSYGKEKDDFNVYYEKSTIQEFIKDEEDNLKNQIINDFLNRNKKKYDRLPVKEYINILRHVDEDLYYEILREENKYRRIDRIINKAIDAKTITLAEYYELKLALFNAKDNTEMMALLQEHKAK